MNLITPMILTQLRDKHYNLRFKKLLVTEYFCPVVGAMFI